MIKRVWTSSEVDLLERSFDTTTPGELMSVFQRSWTAIKQKARKLGLDREAASQRVGNLSPLLQDDPVAHYWIGMLLADGHFSGAGRLRLTLSIKDANHIERFAAFVGAAVTRHRNAVTVGVQDRDRVRLIMRRYGIRSVKTYDPPPASMFDLPDDHAAAMIVGFIDGDGRIAKRVLTKRQRTPSCAGAIKCHNNWLPVLAAMQVRLQEITGVQFAPPKINNAGYAFLSLPAGVLRSLKKIAERCHLPVLDRKWRNVKDDIRNLVPDDVKARIIATRAGGGELNRLARDFGLHVQTIYAIRRKAAAHESRVPKSVVDHTRPEDERQP